MSFYATRRQFKDGSKDITRRLGWTFLKPGDRFMAVEKGQGLKKGEKVVRLGVCEVVSVRRERLNEISCEDVRREGFPEMLRADFIDMFRRMNGCLPSSWVTRIEFKRVKE
jgi:hypothetical protein